MDISRVKLNPIISSLTVLDIDDNEYFGPKYKDYISNSRLSLINPLQGGSPSKYKNGLGNSYSDSLYFGGCVHQLILQPEEFELNNYVNRPSGKVGFIADILYNKYVNNECITDESIIEAASKVDYYGGNISKNRIESVKSICEEYLAKRKSCELGNKKLTQIYLDIKSRDKLEQCVKSVNNNKRIQNLLHPSYMMDEPISKNEVTFIIDIEAEVDNSIVPLKFKAKLDNYTINLETNTVTLNDLKTTGHFISKFNDSWERYHYYRQMAAYIWLLKEHVKQLYNSDFDLYANMLLVSTVPEYKSGVYKVKSEEIKRGFSEFSDLLKMVAYCEKYGYD